MGEKMTRREWLIHRIVMAGGDQAEAAEIVADLARSHPEDDYDHGRWTMDEWEAMPAARPQRSRGRHLGWWLRGRRQAASR